MVEVCHRDLELVSLLVAHGDLVLRLGGRGGERRGRGGEGRGGEGRGGEGRGGEGRGGEGGGGRRRRGGGEGRGIKGGHCQDTSITLAIISSTIH